MKKHLEGLHGNTPAANSKIAYLMNHSEDTHNKAYGRVEGRATDLYGPALIPENLTKKQTKNLPPVVEDSDDEGEVQTKPLEDIPQGICDTFINKNIKPHQTLYLVKWQGYKWTECSWEPAASFPPGQLLKLQRMKPPVGFVPPPQPKGRLVVPPKKRASKKK